MTPNPMTPPLPSSTPLRALNSVYTTPTISDLGTVGAVTAGPETGALDQLGGASGGFIVATGTS